MKKMKCIKTVEVLGKLVYLEGKTYETMEYLEDGELKGYKIECEYGMGFVSTDDEILNNFEEVKDSYEIKAIYNKDISQQMIRVFEFDGNQFLHELDSHTPLLTYLKEDVIRDKDWLLFEVFNGEIKRIKRKNIEEALYVYQELNKK